MNRPLVEKIAQAVLYEGYILYPYRPSMKNQHRWTFGGLYPLAYGELLSPLSDSSIHTECIVVGSDSTLVGIETRFLHLTDRRVGKFSIPLRQEAMDDEATLEIVESFNVGGKKYSHWQEAVERKVAVSATPIRSLARPIWQKFSFPKSLRQEQIKNASGEAVGGFIREQQAVEGEIQLLVEKLGDGVFRICLHVGNYTQMDIPSSASVNERTKADAARALRDEALMRSLVSCHFILGVENGNFISMTDPPDEMKEAVAACKNVGVWPVLVGEAPDASAMLASPIILYDYPQIAPQSPGDLFDGGEIDEILSLRILTLTDEEKREVAGIDQRADAMLKRTQSLAREQLMSLHGTMRGVEEFPAADVLPEWDLLAERPKLPSVSSGGIELHPGDRVRLKPRGGADAFDMMLAGKIATITVIEQDYEDRIHLSVTVEDDPGADFGVAGKPGHRFFFRPDEVELVE